MKVTSAITFQLTFWGGATPSRLHRWKWNLARRSGPLVDCSMTNFTPIRATFRPCRVKSLKIAHSDFNTSPRATLIPLLVLRTAGSKNSTFLGPPAASELYGGRGPRAHSYTWKCFVIQHSFTIRAHWKSGGTWTPSTLNPHNSGTPWANPPKF